MRRYTVQDLFSFQAALRDSPYGGCFSPYSPLFRKSQVTEGNLSALRHLPYEGRLSALLIGELSALLTERFFQTMRRYTVQDLFSFRAALRDGPYGGCFPTCGLRTAACVFPSWEWHIPQHSLYQCFFSIVLVLVVPVDVGHASEPRELAFGKAPRPGLDTGHGVVQGHLSLKI